MDDESFTAFKRLRNQLAKRDITSLVIAASAKLHLMETLPIEKWEGWLPWYLLTLIRWGFEYGGTQYPAKPVDNATLEKLMGMVHHLVGTIKYPFLEEGTISGLLKFLRTTAFQQFWLQQSLGTWDLARQYALFCKLPAEHPIQENFNRLIGISMSDALVFEMLLWSWLAKDPQNIVFQAPVLFQNISYSEDELSAFLRALALPKPDVAQYLGSRRQAITNPIHQLTEQTPFVRYPCLQMNGQYLVYSRRVYEQTVNNFFYDVMKTDGTSALSELFAPVLERYVGKSLGQVFDEYYTESELIRCFPGSKVTDFLLPLENSTVMIEVKATEIKPSIKAFPETERLVRELKSSIIKATIQGFTLANIIKDKAVGMPVKCSTRYFLLIVTYRQMYLGSGEDIWNEFLRDAIAPELQKLGISEELIAPGRIVVLSIEEFDLLISVLLTKKVTLSQILEKLLANNANLQTRKLNFSQHLDEFRTDDAYLPYLDDEFAELEKNAHGRFKSCIKG